MPEGGGIQPSKSKLAQDALQAAMIAVQKVKDKLEKALKELDSLEKD